MTEENIQLLEEAKRRYRLGTVFLSAAYNVESIVSEESYYWSNDGIIVKANRPSEGAENSGTYCYYKQKWGEIKESQIKTNYQIY